MRTDARTARDRGFSLVELLVVVIVIGILAAIAIPVFLNQRKKAVEASMKSDIRNVVRDVNAYFVENEEYASWVRNRPESSVIWLGVGFGSSSWYTWARNPGAVWLSDDGTGGAIDRVMFDTKVGNGMLYGRYIAERNADPARAADRGEWCIFAMPEGTTNADPNVNAFSNNVLHYDSKSGFSKGPSTRCRALWTDMNRYS